MDTTWRPDDFLAERGFDENVVNTWQYNDGTLVELEEWSDLRF